MPSLVGERQCWRHFRRQFGRGQLRVKNCRETVASQFLPRDIKVSRRALWAGTISNFPEPPTPGIFSKVSPVQIGGALRYKLEACCSTNWRCIAAFPFLQSLEASEAQPRCKWGAVLRYKLEVYRQYFSDKLYGLGAPKQSPDRVRFSPRFTQWKPVCPWDAQGRRAAEKADVLIGIVSSTSSPIWCPPGCCRTVVYQSRFLGRGSDEALFSSKKGVFSEKGGGIQ